MDAIKLKAADVRAELTRRGLGTAGKIADLRLRLETALSAERAEGATFEFPAAFPADARQTVNALDLTTLPAAARRPLCKILVKLYAAVDLSTGSPDEQLGRAIIWAKDLLKSARLPPFKRNRSLDVPSFAVALASNVARGLADDDATNTKALALTAALGLPLLAPVAQGGAGGPLGGGGLQAQGGAGAGAGIGPDREALRAELERIQRDADAIRAALGLTGAQTGGAATGEDARRAEQASRRGRLFTLFQSTVVTALNADRPSGTPPSIADDVALGKLIVTALGGDASPLASLPHDAGVVQVRSSVLDCIVGSTAVFDAPEDQLDLLKLFIVATATRSCGDPAVRLCTWANFAGLRGQVRALVPSASETERLAWAADIFAVDAWTRAPVPAPVAALPSPSPSVGAGGAGGAAVSRPGNTHPRGRQSLAAATSDDGAIPIDSDEDEDAALTHATASRTPRRPSGESLTQSDVLMMSKFVKEIQSNIALRCGKPVGAEGSAADRAGSIAAAHRLLARNFDAPAPATVDLGRIFDTTYGYAITRVSPRAMASLDESLARIVQATQGASVLSGVDLSFISNAIYNLTRAGSRIGFAVDTATGLLVADIANAQDVPATPAAFAGWWFDVITPAVISVLEAALDKRPVLLSHSAPAGAVAPCVALVHFLGEKLTVTLQRASATWSSARVPWLVVFLLSDIYFAGRAHIELHAGLTAPAAEFPILATLSAQSSLASCPNYFAYTSRPGFVPTARSGAALGPAARAPRDHSRSGAGGSTSRNGSQRDSQKRSLSAHTPRSLPAAAAAVESRPGAVLPWVLSHPDVPRERNCCPFCGPGVSHSLKDCVPNSSYQRTAGAIRMPGVKEFPIGTTFAAYKSSLGN